MSESISQTIKGVIDEPIGLSYTFDYSKADLEAHNYAVEKLREKFGDKGRCTLLDYILFYGEALKKEEDR